MIHCMILICMIVIVFYIDNYYYDPELIDPYESYNRKVYAFNLFVEKKFILPITNLYSEVVPKKAKGVLGNFFGNLREPGNFIVFLFQGNVDNAVKSFWRFILNSSYGIFGLFDFAGEIGIETNKTNFDSLFASNGMAMGKYLVLPIVGPSSSRKVFSVFFDLAFDPLLYISDFRLKYGLYGVRGIDIYYDYGSVFSEISSLSLDPYVRMRDLYVKRVLSKNKLKNLY